MRHTKINAIGFNVAGPDEEQLDAGAPPLVTVVIGDGMPLPIGGPDGQPLLIVSEQIEFALDKDAAVALGKQLLENAKVLPDPIRSDIIVPGNANVDRVAEDLANLRGSTG